MSQNIMTTDIKQIKFEKFNKAFTIINVVIAGLFTLLFLVLFILVESGLVRLVISGIWFAFNLIMVLKCAEKIHVAVNIILTVIFVTILFFQSIFFLGFSSDTPWKYNFQKSYIIFRNNYEFRVAPEKLPDDISDYSMEYLPSIMQGTGHSSVRFKASQDVIKAYEEEYSAKAIYTYPLSVFDEGHITVEKVSPKAAIGMTDDKSLFIYRDTDFWAESTSATVYVTSATHNWNHPHSTAVIIYSEKNMIEFAQLG
ncbi:MAG: hypothetical protein IJB68_07185 [Ruminococcus sp.]|nr:hypothetical protein [Ruminococcus sp.]